jgi:heme-degrading monooxygenase HmoA
MADRPETDGPVVTIFRSRLREGVDHEYATAAERILDLARSQPGFVSFEHYAAGGGERVSIVTFASAADHEAWRDHPEHVEAQRLGRERFYAEFRIQVCRPTSDRRFVHGGG